MLRRKVTELGKLNFLGNGGLVCSVTSDQPPSLDASARAASFYWASPDPSELAIGDRVAHSEHGVARYLGRESINQGDGEGDFLVLEFAHGARLYVPTKRSDLVQKIDVDCALSTLDAKGDKRPQSYCFEALPKAYEWPGIGAFPKLPQESEFHRSGTAYRESYRERAKSREAQLEAYGLAMTEWRRGCATYQKALHANASYRQAAHEYFERQNREPQRVLDWWVYRTMVLRVGAVESTNEHLLLIKQYVLRRERMVEKIRREVETLERCESVKGAGREPIPEHVRLFVWRRDKGQCVRCGSRERLEFDHIIPVVAGGSNTERNIQLLCESCNRSKSATV
jgi:HNH endonuclease/CarD-like/TRCF domain